MKYAQMLADLLAHFEDSQLNELCTQFGVDPERLQGKDRWDKMRMLLSTAEAEGFVPQLIKMMVSQRPQLGVNYPDEDLLSWIDQVVPEERKPVEELPTLKWPANRRLLTNEAAVLTTEENTADEIPTMTWPEELERDGKIKDSADGHDGSLAGDAQWFVGRSAERHRLATQLSQISSCAVVGTPDIGKSSLLRYLSEAHPFPAEHQMLFAYLDLRDEQYHHVAGLHNGALAGWYAHLLDAPPPLAPSMADFRRQIRNLFEAGFRPVLCLDGFEWLLTLPDAYNNELFAAWHQLAQAGQMTFLVAAEQSLSDLMKRNGLSTAFPKLFSEVELGLLEEDAARCLLADQLSANDTTVPAEWIESLLELCGRHPFYLKLAAEIASVELSMDEPDYRSVSRELKRQAAAGWRHLWQTQSRRQKLLLTNAIPDDPPLVLARQYQRLARRGLLVEADGRYQLFSQGFAEWLTNRR